MSYRHVTLIKESADLNVLRYKVMSPDFAENNQVECLATLKVDLKNKSFELQDSELWFKYKLYPLDLFLLNPTDRANVVKEKYSDFGSGAWVKSIFDCATELVNGTRLPEPELNLIA